MRLVGVALVALALLAPGVAAKDPPAPEYPADLLGLLPRWIEQAGSEATSADQGKSWWNETGSYLEKARDARDEGRLRIAMFHLETYHELLVVNRLEDEARQLSNDADRKALVLQRTLSAHQESERVWAAFRAELHAYDGELRSLQTIEKAMYAADVGVAGMLTAADWEYLSKEFPKQEGFPEPYVYSLVHVTTTPQLNVGWAREMLAEIVKQEGLPPRVVDDAWANTTAAALLQPEDAPRSSLKPLEDLAAPARANDEALLAVTLALDEQRALRADGMHTIFGDARARGLPVVQDAARGMSKQLNNTTLETPRSYGLSGVFTSDAIDRAEVTLEYVRTDQADLSVTVAAWAALEHATYVTSALSRVSPVVPPPTPSKSETPGLLAPLAILALAGLALARRG